MAFENNVGLLFSIRAKNDTKPAFDDLKKDVKSAGDVAEDAAGGGLSSFASQLGLAGGGLEALAGPIGAATAAITGIATAATIATTVIIGTATALFNLAEKASEFGSEIFDASEKTGLSAETLSALKVAADQSGSSLEAITGSVSKFEKLIAQAAEGTKSAKDALIELGLDPKTAIGDLDGSLEIVFKRIADAQNPIVATRLATEAFGKSGAELIPVIRSFDGDMAGLIARAKELGVTLTNADAAASDDFGDSLDSLKASAAGLSNQFAFQFMPQITEAMKFVTKIITDNKTEVLVWGTVVKDILNALPTLAEYAIGAFNTVLEALNNSVKTLTFGLIDLIPLINTIKPLFDDAASDYYEKTKQKIIDKQKNTLSMEGRVPNSADGIEDKVAAEKAAKDREAALKKQLELVLKYNKLKIEAEKLFLDEADKTNQEALKKGDITLDLYTQKTLENLRDFQARVANVMTDSFNQSIVGKSKAEIAVMQKEYDNDIKKFWDGVDAQKTELLKKQTDEEKKAADERLKVLENENSRKLALDKASAETRLAQLKSDLDKGLITEVEYAKAVAVINLRVIENKKALLQEERKGLDLRGEKYKEITKDIALLDEELTQQQIENAKAVEEAFDKAVSARAKLGSNAGGEKAPDKGKSGGSTELPHDGAGDFFGGLFKGLGTSVEELEEPVSALSGLGNILAETFQQVAGAVGNAVMAFVKFGSAGGSFRKFAAEVVGSIAQMAVVNAVWELAQGLAMSALAWFTGNPKYAASAAEHYAAAAIFGTIGGVAAVAGRAIAGNAFNKENERATGQSSGGNSSGSGNQGGRIYSSAGDDATTIDIGRNAPGRTAAIGQMLQNMQPKVIIESKDGLPFEEFFRIRVSRPGSLRDAIRDID